MLVEAVNGRSIDPGAGWFTAQELAGLPGMAKTDRGVRIAAEKNLWPFRAKARSKALEYPLASLPEATRAYLISLSHDAVAVTALPPPPPTPRPTPPLPAGALAARGQVRRLIGDDQITDAGRAYRDAALLLCRAVDEAMAVSGASQRQACQELALRLVGGEAHAELGAAAQATYLKPRAGEPLGGVAAQAARLSKLHAFFLKGCQAGDPGRYLVPGKRPEGGHHPLHVAGFLRFYCNPRRPSVAECHRDLAEFLRAQGAPDVSYSTLLRIENELPVTVKYRGRVTGSAWRALLPYIERDVSMFKSNDIWVGDGHSFKAKVQHPIHGQPFTPEVTILLDWVSRKAVGYSVSLSESTVAVSDAFRHAQSVTRARPLIYYSDNGAGQTGKKIDAPITGTLARQGIAHHTGIPGNPQGRGVIERLWQVVTIPLARKYATCTWRGADDNATTKMLKLLNRKDGGGVPVPSFRQFLDDLKQAIDDYNLHHVHSDFGGTPEDQYQARIDKDSIVFGPSDAELAALWMPEVIRTPSRGLVQLFGNTYSRRDLVQILPEGATVRVRYDLHDASKVWLLTLEGRLIGEALWNGHAREAFPVSEMDQLRAQRAAGKTARGERIIAEAQAELAEVIEIAPRVVPVPVADYLPVAPSDVADDEGKATMSHEEMVMWLYGPKASAGPDGEADSFDVAAG